MSSLLAKSSPPGCEPLSLAQHTADVITAAEVLFSCEDRHSPSRLGECWRRFFKIADGDWPRFVATLRTAAAFHDWGKANAEMQGLLRQESVTQAFWHEHLSGLMLISVWDWATQTKDVEPGVMLAAVVGHHLRYSSSDEFPTPVADVRVANMLYHAPEFREVLDVIEKHTGIQGMPKLPQGTRWSLESRPRRCDLKPYGAALRDRLYSLNRCDVPDAKLRMLRAVRSALIVADAAASGLRRQDETIPEWLRQQFSEDSLCDETLVGNLIDRRIAQLQATGKTFKWNEFQDRCETLGPRALLLAPCGSGKTLAAWRWAQARVAAAKRPDARPVKRILFLYPTRATATEGFRDYVSWAPEGTLVHGTASYELQGMFLDVDDCRTSHVFKTDPRLFAIGYWSKQVFSATVDTFLAFMGHAYGPACLLPVLADSLVIIDEVHSFDESMFSKLRAFLKEFDVPVLCMTATLPQSRIEALQSADPTLSVCNDQPEELRNMAEAKRYRIRRVDTPAAALAAAAEAVGRGRRVLWVVNQVQRAQDVTRDLSERFPGIPVHCYHSRFKLVDRQHQHEKVVEAFQTSQGAVIGVTTQVCEMSLDLDADLLITEWCPMTSLIQRMGRCRRNFLKLEERGPGEVLVYRPENDLPYGEIDLRGIDPFLDEMVELGLVSQNDLEAGLRKFGPTEVEFPRYSAFVQSGADAMGGEDPFRDIDQFTLPAVLQSEVDQYLNDSPDRQPGYVLPVPRKDAQVLDPPRSKWSRYLRVADDACYDRLTGFRSPSTSRVEGP